MDMIEKFADEQGAHITKTKLESQFRCNGSDGFLAWVDDVLEIRETANSNAFGSDYDYRVYSDPIELRQEIEKLNKLSNKSRLVAGYCWNWIKEGKSDTNIHDIELPGFNFSMSWNLWEFRDLGDCMKRP